MDYIVAGCHDSTVHIYHFKRQRKSGVELQARAGGGPDRSAAALADSRGCAVPALRWVGPLGASAGFEVCCWWQPHLTSRSAQLRAAGDDMRRL